MVGKNGEVEEICETTSYECDLQVDNDSDRRKRFTVKGFIPKKYNYTEIFKLRNITSFLIILLLLIIVILLSVNNSRNAGTDLNYLSVLSSDSNNKLTSTIATIANDSIIEIYDIIKLSTTDTVTRETESLEYSYEVILSDLSKLWVYKISSNSLYILNQFKKNITTLEVSPGQAIFLVFQNESKIINFPYNGTSSADLNVLFEEIRIKPRVMAFDDIGDNLYVADNITGNLFVINMKNMRHNILMPYLQNVCDIDLDPDRGIMFILQYSISILQTTMDGTVIMEIISDKLMTAITLDRKNKRIYWLNEHKGIQILNYYGDRVGKVEIDHSDIVNIAIVDDKLFWLWLQYDGIKSPSHHLVYCQLKNFSCENHEMQKLDYSIDVKLMKVVRNRNYNKTVSKDKLHPCQVSNGGCEHLCLLVLDGKQTCVCSIGWQLNPDKKTCREVKDYLLYIYNGFFRGRILDVTKSSSIDIIWPTPPLMDNYDKIFFDYDLSNDDLYYSNSSNIYVTKIRSNWTSPTSILKVDDFDIIDLTIDWKTGDLYYIKNEYNVAQRDSIVIFNTKVKKIVRTIYPCKTFCLKWLTFDSYHDSLFYLRLENINTINRISRNNSNVIIYIGKYFSINYLNDIAVDPQRHEVYWTDMNEILCVTFNETNQSQFRLYDTGQIETINVYRNWIFVSTQYLIQRIDRKTGKIKLNLKLRWKQNIEERISDVKMISDIRDRKDVGA